MTDAPILDLKNAILKHAEATPRRLVAIADPLDLASPRLPATSLMLWVNALFLSLWMDFIWTISCSRSVVS